MLADELLELPHELACRPSASSASILCSSASEPDLLEPLDRGLRKRLVGDVGERGATPKRERLAQEVGRSLRLAARRATSSPRQ